MTAPTLERDERRVPSGQHVDALRGATWHMPAAANRIHAATMLVALVQARSLDFIALQNVTPYLGVLRRVASDNRWQLIEHDGNAVVVIGDVEVTRHGRTAGLPYVVLDGWVRVVSIAADVWPDHAARLALAGRIFARRRMLVLGTWDRQHVEWFADRIGANRAPLRDFTGLRTVYAVARGVEVTNPRSVRAAGVTRLSTFTVRRLP